MNIRYAVLCERLRLRARVRECHPLHPPTTDAQLDATEQGLGFKLPPMLRVLYREIENGGHAAADRGGSLQAARPALPLAPGELDYTTGQAPSQLEAWRSDSNKRWPPEIVAALRQHPGTYVKGLFWPEGFVELANMGEVELLLLDGRTGHLYLEFQADENLVSFFAPSVEDWLERELDAISHGSQYYPHTELTTIRSVGSLEEDSSLADPVYHEDTQQQAQAETEHLRTENLDTGDTSPQKKGALRGPGPFSARDGSPVSMSHVPVEESGWRMWQARQQLLREMYTLMALLEAEQDAAEGQRVGEEQFLEGLRPLLEADAQLAYLLEHIWAGYSYLYEARRRWPRLS